MRLVGSDSAVIINDDLACHLCVLGLCLLPFLLQPVVVSFTFLLFFLLVVLILTGSPAVKIAF